MPGRKTDAKDCEWIVDLLQHGLLKGSYVPSTSIQDLRNLTRYRVELRESQSQSRAPNHIQRLLEQVNLKLGSVAFNALDVSGRHIGPENVSTPAHFCWVTDVFRLISLLIGMADGASIECVAAWASLADEMPVSQTGILTESLLGVEV